MTTEEKALALLNEVQGSTFTSLTRDSSAIEALCRAIEQHEAFRQEVSDVVEEYCKGHGIPNYDRFIIPKPDPLVEALNESGVILAGPVAKDLRAALEARGLEIRGKNDD